MEPEVWLVNDDPAQLMVQKRLLERVIPGIRDFLSPFEALAAAREARGVPYLVTDFQMPLMDGPALAQQWHGLFPSSRILIVSASEVTGDDQRRVDALPADSVRLLTSYRVAELAANAKLWFFSVEEQLLSPVETVGGSFQDFDPSVLAKLASLGGKEFVQKTLERFLRSVPEKIGLLKEAASSLDFARLHALAHSLKGSCGLVGALALARAADALESAAGERTDADFVELVRRLETEAEVTLKTLRARIS